MVKIFHDVFGNKLVEEKTIKQRSINELPSPFEFQRKIILIGSVVSKILHLYACVRQFLVCQ